MSEETKRILIVEDEKAMANALRLKLEHEGFVVQMVNDGDEAKNLLADNKFDLILTDLMMPKFSGFDLLHKLKEMEENTPVVVLSNLSQSEDLEKAKKLGARDYLVKSDISLAEIVVKVKALLT
jgi:DNA-binding response OmpR family regulator